MDERTDPAAAPARRTLEAQLLERAAEPLAMVAGLAVHDGRPFVIFHAAAGFRRLEIPIRGDGVARARGGE